MKASELTAAIQDGALAFGDPEVLVWHNGQWCDVVGVAATGEHRNAVQIQFTSGEKPSDPTAE